MTPIKIKKTAKIAHYKNQDFFALTADRPSQRAKKCGYNAVIHPLVFTINKT